MVEIYGLDAVDQQALARTFRLEYPGLILELFRCDGVTEWRP
jgi:hypothetical protein